MRFPNGEKGMCVHVVATTTSSVINLDPVVNMINASNVNSLMVMVYITNKTTNFCHLNLHRDTRLKCLGVAVVNYTATKRCIFDVSCSSDRFVECVYFLGGVHSNSLDFIVASNAICELYIFENCRFNFNESAVCRSQTTLVKLCVPLLVFKMLPGVIPSDDKNIIVSTTCFSPAIKYVKAKFPNLMSLELTNELVACCSCH